jgi:rubrerythrin
MQNQDPLTCEVLNTLNEALCHEQAGAAFYRKAAQSTVDESGAEMFEKLAQESEQQIEMLQRQIQRLEADSGWDLPGCVFDCQLDIEEPLYPRSQDEQQEAVDPYATQLGALAFAMNQENKGYDLYVRHAQASQDERAQSLYEYLATQSRQRFELLRLNYEDIAQGAAF